LRGRRFDGFVGAHAATAAAKPNACIVGGDGERGDQLFDVRPISSCDGHGYPLNLRTAPYAVDRARKPVL
jgi:hypothetical protein